MESGVRGLRTELSGTRSMAGCSASARKRRDLPREEGMRRGKVRRLRCMVLVAGVELEMIVDVY